MYLLCVQWKRGCREDGCLVEEGCKRYLEENKRVMCTQVGNSTLYFENNICK